MCVLFPCIVDNCAGRHVPFSGRAHHASSWAACLSVSGPDAAAHVGLMVQKHPRKIWGAGPWEGALLIHLDSLWSTNKSVHIISAWLLPKEHAHQHLHQHRPNTMLEIYFYSIFSWTFKFITPRMFGHTQSFYSSEGQCPLLTSRSWCAAAAAAGHFGAYRITQMMKVKKIKQMKNWNLHLKILFCSWQHYSFHLGSVLNSKLKRVEFQGLICMRCSIVRLNSDAD